MKRIKQLFEKLKKRRTSAVELSNGESAAAAGFASWSDLTDDASLRNLATAQAGSNSQNCVTLPFLGRHNIAYHLRVLFLTLGISLGLLILLIAYSLYHSDSIQRQISATDQAMIHSQRLAKSAMQAMTGDAAGFQNLQQSSKFLTLTVDGLKDGNRKLGIHALPDSYKMDLAALTSRVGSMKDNSSLILSQKEVLTQVDIALKNIQTQSKDQLKIAEKLATDKTTQRSNAEDMAAASRLVVLTERIDNLSQEFLTIGGINANSILELGKNLNTIKNIIQGMLVGDSALHLQATHDDTTSELLTNLDKMYDKTKLQVGVIMVNLTGLVAAREAQEKILEGGEPLRTDLEKLRIHLAANSGIGVATFVLMLILAVLSFGSAVGLSYAQLQKSRKRKERAQEDKQVAIDQEQKVRRINAANQSAILRLMNELQLVAGGDLTQEKTVTEDITEAIADSINLTIDELRDLLIQVKNVSSKISTTSNWVNKTSNELLGMAQDQLKEIHQTEVDVVEMASRFSLVSQDAQNTAEIVKSSLALADNGLQAVQNSIGGMSIIRTQTQDTVKRIKRLGESSQEIGEIIELIADTTERTNVLALNAAIQAACAGEAGRSFSVVAEEVQRLSERSLGATKQISVLIRAIQTAAQDAINAMEISTQGVVQIAKFSDIASASLTDIDKSSRNAAKSIEQISLSTAKEAEISKEIAKHIQHIFSVTEHTTSSTSMTAEQIRKLEQMAKNLVQSIERLKVEKDTVIA